MASSDSAGWVNYQYPYHNSYSVQGCNPNQYYYPYWQQSHCHFIQQAHYASNLPPNPPSYWESEEEEFEKLPKRCSSSSKKEKRRTQNINNAFAELRECIPNIPGDSKLSKIKTLRLATSYIAHLMKVLQADNQVDSLAAEFAPKSKILCIQKKGMQKTHNHS